MPIFLAHIFRCHIYFFIYDMYEMYDDFIDVYTLKCFLFGTFIYSVFWKISNNKNNLLTVKSMFKIFCLICTENVVN